MKLRGYNKIYIWKKLIKMAYKMLRLLPLMTNTIDSSNNGVDKVKKLMTRRHYQVLGTWLYGRVLG